MALMAASQTNVLPIKHQALSTRVELTSQSTSRTISTPDECGCHPVGYGGSTPPRSQVNTQMDDDRKHPDKPDQSGADTRRLRESSSRAKMSRSWSLSTRLASEQSGDELMAAFQDGNFFPPPKKKPPIPVSNPADMSCFHGVLVYFSSRQLRVFIFAFTKTALWLSINMPLPVFESELHQIINNESGSAFLNETTRHWLTGDNIYHLINFFECISIRADMIPCIL